MSNVAVEHTNSMNSTPSSERVHISFFGMRNAGKSSVVNAVLGQDLSIVSDVLGTTTDPVNKAMELLPLGPVLITDTPGLDDVGELGALRVKKSKQILNKTDIAVLVVDALVGLQDFDHELIQVIKQKGIPYLIVYNKSDLVNVDLSEASASEIYVSAKMGHNIYELKERLARLAGGVAVIEVGAPTEVELKERKLRIEDALNASRVAIKEGVVEGGGVCLLKAGETIKALD